MKNLSNNDKISILIGASCLSIFGIFITLSNYLFYQKGYYDAMDKLDTSLNEVYNNDAMDKTVGATECISTRKLYKQLK